MKLKNLFGGWIHRGTLAGASLTALLGAGNAAAQMEPSPQPLCPTPTLSTCQSEGYLTSYCGQKHSTLCNDLIGEEFKQQWNTLTTEHVTLLPDSFGGTLGTSRPTAYSALGSTYMENGGGTYVGTVLKNQVLYRKNFQNLSSSDIAQRDALQQWDARGTTVRSCKEFVHKKFHDYSVFEDAMGAHGSDYRKVFNAAYAPDGIAYKELKGKAGNTLAPIFNAMSTAPKNLYFKAEQGPYPTGVQGYAIDPTLLQKVPTEGRRYYTPSWAWHKQMSDSLAKENDALLNRLFVKQQGFSALVDQRKAVWDDYSSQSQKLSGPALDRLRQRVTERLIGLDQAIEAGLREADALNCLTLNGNLRCDWSPDRFKTMIEEVMMARRHADYALCLTMTGNDFGPYSYVRNADNLGISGLSGDYTVSPAKLNEYMSTYRSAMLQQPRLYVPATKETRRSDSRSSSDSFGNSNFGANYELAAGWEFNTTTSGGLCQSFDARVYAYLESNAWIFGTSREILYAGAEGTATTGQVGYDAVLRVLGSDVFHESNTYSTSFAVTPGVTLPRRTFITAKSYFLLAGIPISVSGGASGTVGLDTVLSGQFNSGCRFTLGAEVKPWARLDAYAEVAVDLVIASAGVRGELTLVKVELPYDVSLAVFLESTGSGFRTMFELDTNLQLKLTTLDGRIVVFVKAFGLNAEKELASFNGITTTTTLLNETRTVPLSSFF